MFKCMHVDLICLGASSLQECYEEAVMGMFNFMSDTSYNSSETMISREIVVES